ncbi:hypothetical protein Q5425_26510 [Amycolatopsis sp. A133]|uniref:hypothetical protein n=1 Tax=Amycolatopsis sp. A133 TaxID=3064472 RepID=UPI0027F29D6F|nr:hypothetical protein [Amycolatopsis sp. A133]MDQ7807304.1 hypothetical protein [Amycolatopsis sp. A133]
MSWLSAFGRGEDLPSGHLPPIDAELGPQMTERLARHVADAFHDRLRRWQEAFSREQQLLLARPERAVTVLAVVLADARKRLGPLVAFTVHPGLPDELRTSVADALRETISSAQRSLEDSVRDAPAPLRNAVRQNSLEPALTRTAAPSPTGPARGRRVILD